MNMRSFSIALVCITAVACDNKGSGPGGAPSSAPSAAASGLALPSAAQGAIDRLKPLTDTSSRPLTPDEYEKLLLALESCKVKEEGAIDYECDAMKKLNEARNAKTAIATIGGIMGGLGKKHIKHQSPAVRIQSAHLMGSAFGADKDTQAMVLTAINDEKDPAVVAALIEVVGSKGGANPEVGKMLLASADHTSPLVRRRAISWLGSSWNKDVAGRVPKLIDKIEKDAEPKIKQHACQMAGQTGDDKLIPIYDKYTKDDKDGAMYSACMTGLLATWANSPFWETTSEKGYRLFLQRLKDAPRSDTRPPWTIMSSLGALGGDSDSLRKWRAIATWYKQADLVKALEGIVKDERAQWMARTGAVKAMSQLKTSKAELETLEKACDKCNSHVQKALKEAVATAK